MKRFPILGVLLLIPAIFILGMTGCQKDKPTDKPKPGGDGGDKPKTQAKKITSPTDGTVKGVVKFDGDAPTPKPINMGTHEDKGRCMAGKDKNPVNVQEQMWIVNKDGGVANAIVYLEPAEDKIYDVKDDLKAKWKKNPAIIDQPFCAYTPHAIGLFAEHQPLWVKNSATFTHNVKIDGGEDNRNTNDPMKAGETLKRGIFVYDRKPINVSCSMHTWMSAKIVTFKHPYFAVTKDNGSFEITDVPSGEELRVFMWHESLDKAKEVSKVTAKAGEKTTIDNLKIK